MSHTLTRNGLVFAGLVLTASPLLGATYNVTSISSLQTRINSAVAGDVIILQDGSYTTSAAISVNKVGTSASPITIKAQTVGGVTIGGTHGFNFSSPAAYVTVQGFRFTHANAVNIPSGTHHIRILRNVFQLTIAAGADVSYLNINGDDVEIGYNELRNKSTLGNMLDVAGSGSQVARRLWVHHNYFHDFTSPGPGTNGAETIRLGLSGLSMSTGSATIEHNLFVRCNGENELISNKSSGNTYRYNTFLDSPGAQLTLRHGNDCKIYGNYFRNTDGLRVYGDRHQIFSNYFEGNTKGIDMGNGDGEVADGAALTCHDRPDNAVVTFNTFVNNTLHYQMMDRVGGLGALNVTVANNIMQGAGNAASISSTAPHTGTWSDNILWNVTTAGNMPSSGYSNVDPLMAPDARGVYHLQPGSPAIDTAGGTYSAVTVDMDGQPRSGAKDKGADEVSGAAATAVILTAAEVGPNAGTSYVEVTLSGAAATASTHDGNVPANVVDNNLSTRWSANGDGQWLQLDLGTQRTVGHVKVAVYNGSTRKNNFEIQVATTSGVWTTVWSGESSGTTTAEETYDFTDVPARWVRYLGHMNNVNGFNSVTEISIFAVP